ncbi:uncharacterized protein LOC123565354 [Mercenaria mercenaria]|uniref:uncharacterized protein LOC123565354 n=1 Tax=Mercenaria mercenaria TaxID=6596 RepID=UPI00234E516C|nr:uncharacterized protein LOC123565354 [Mercenaria mercenaria]
MLQKWKKNNSKQARNKVNYELKRCKYNYERNLATKIKDDSKVFWKYVRQNTKTDVTVGSLEDEYGKCVQEDGERARILNKQLCSVFTVEDVNNIPNFEDRPYLTILEEINIREDDVKKHIQTLNPKKAVGPDGIHPRVVKECIDPISVLLRRIFIKTLNEGELPIEWKDANVTALYKSGKRSKPENYRPISDTSICCWLLERIIREAIV